MPGAADEVLLVTGSGPDRSGGFFVVDRDPDGSWTVEQLDRIRSFGITCEHGFLYRMLGPDSNAPAGAELLVYDAVGVVEYRRIDSLVDPHGIVWTGSHFAVPSPAQNGIALMDRCGAVADWIRLPGTGDAWHVNGVTVRAGRLCASAFGRFTTARGWSAGGAAGQGEVFDVENRQSLVDGLDCPHDPIFLDGAWIVCDSGAQRLVAVDERTREIARCIDLGAWTRGLAASTGSLFVGLSGERYGTELRLGSVAVLDRRTWQSVARITLPCQEILTLARVPRTFLAALRRGFRTNAARVTGADRRDPFPPVGSIDAQVVLTPMRALEPAEARIHIDAVAPAGIAVGARFPLDVAIRNEGPRALFGAAPFPVYVGCRWSGGAGSAADEALDEHRRALPEPIAPGATLHFAVQVYAPSAAGTYCLRVTLVQHGIRRFDTDDAALGVDLHLTIAERRSSEHTESVGPSRFDQ